MARPVEKEEDALRVDFGVSLQSIVGVVSVNGNVLMTFSDRP